MLVGTVVRDRYGVRCPCAATVGQLSGAALRYIISVPTALQTLVRQNE